MRQCIFVTGTRAQLGKIAPVLKLAGEQGLRHSVWYTGEQYEPIEDLVEEKDLRSSVVFPDGLQERSVFGRLLVWLPSTVYRCYHYVSGVKAWTGRRPIIVVCGDTLSTWLGAVAGSWGGGDVAYLESGSSTGTLFRRLTFRKTRFGLCPNDDAAGRLQEYPGCIVVNTSDDPGIPPSQAAVDALIRWAS